MDSDSQPYHLEKLLDNNRLLQAILVLVAICGRVSPHNDNIETLV